MMNIDMVRAGGEGMTSLKKRDDGKDKNVEMEEDGPKLFSSEEHDLKVSVPEGWSVGKR